MHERLEVSPGGFAFLDEDVIITTDSDWNCLHIYHIPPTGSLEDLEVRLVHSLELPPIREQHFISDFLCRSSPNPSSRLSYVNRKTVDIPSYLPDPASAIIIFYMEAVDEETVEDQFHNIGREEEPYTSDEFAMIVHRQSLLNLLPLDHTTNGSGIRNILEPIPWSDWGPPISRWFKGDSFRRQMTLCTGQRYIEYDNQDYTGDRIPASLTILDFNPFSIKMALSNIEKKRPEASYLDIFAGKESSNARLSVIGGVKIPDSVQNVFKPEGGHFVSDIHCMLPYLRVSTVEEFQISSFHLGQDLLVALSISVSCTVFQS